MDRWALLALSHGQVAVLATRRPTHVRRTNGAWSAPVTISTTALERLALDRLPLTP